MNVETASSKIYPNNSHNYIIVSAEKLTEAGCVWARLTANRESQDQSCCVLKFHEEKKGLAISSLVNVPFYAAFIRHISSPLWLQLRAFTMD